MNKLRLYLALALLGVGLSFGQEINPPNTTTIAIGKTTIAPDLTGITVQVETTDVEATHALIAVSWRAGSEVGSMTRLVPLSRFHMAFLYVMVNSSTPNVTISTVAATPLRALPMSTAVLSNGSTTYTNP